MRLSKSKLLSFRQCPKRLWLEMHKPELSETDDATQASFARGHAVGKLAWQLYGPGELMFDSIARDYAGAQSRTRDKMSTKPRRALFEATFLAEGVMVMTDILKITATGAKVVEVKSSTSVKDYHLEDCATQAHVIERSGTPVNRIAVAHIDNNFVYSGEGDYRGLLHEENVTAKIAGLREQVPGWIRKAKATLKGDEPDIAPGAQCRTPFACPFQNYCIQKTTRYPVNTLPRVSQKQLTRFAERGIEDIRKIPAGELTNTDQIKVYTAIKSRKAYFDKGATAELRNLAYPRFYLDFETINFAIPIWIGRRPYQQVPFQWSLHIETEPGKFEHTYFLDLSGRDPARNCTMQLLQALGRKGPILVYSSFEKTVLSHMAQAFPDLGTRIEAAINRLFDLFPVARAAYYHPEMEGSWSIKSLLPVIAPDLSYESLEHVQDGDGAQAAYEEAIRPETTASRKAELEQALLCYCKLDTEAMVRVSAFLSTQVGK